MGNIDMRRKAMPGDQVMSTKNSYDDVENKIRIEWEEKIDVMDEIWNLKQKGVVSSQVTSSITSTRSLYNSFILEACFEFRVPLMETHG